MKSILRNLILATTAFAVVVLTAHSAMASATLKVPFSFTVNGKICPAGTYALDRDNITHMVHMRSVDSYESFNWVLGPGSPDPTDTKIALKFDNEGETHALKFVQYGSEITSELSKGGKHSRESRSRVGEGR